MSGATCIAFVGARKVYDSRGDETIEVEVRTLGGMGKVAAPAGKSKGKHEVAYYPPGGVDEAVRKVKELVAPRLMGIDAGNQRLVDRLLHEIDGTEDFSNIGGNAAYAISIATAEAAAFSSKAPLFAYLSKELEFELPLPLGNVVGGGKHAGPGAPDIQEILVLPVGARSVREAIAANIAVHRRVGKALQQKAPGFTGGRGDEGAWAPRMRSEDAIEVVASACEAVSAELGVEIRVGLDVAASSLWREGEQAYVYASDGFSLSQGEQIDFIASLIEKYKLIYVEDPLHEDDFDGFAELTKKAKAKGCIICGDDLFVTNKARLREGIARGSANAVLIKPNQVGTLSDAMDTVRMAKEAGYVTVMSHRSGESCDPHLAHLAIGLGCPIIKAGVIGGERIAKMNELIRIEESLGDVAKVAKLEL